MANIMSITIPIYIQNILQKWFPLHERQKEKRKKKKKKEKKKKKKNNLTFRRGI